MESVSLGTADRLRRQEDRRAALRAAIEDHQDAVPEAVPDDLDTLAPLRYTI